MVSKAENIDSPADRMKLMGAGALVLAALVLFYLLGDFSFLYRVLGLLVVFGAVSYTHLTLPTIYSV